MPKDGVEQKTKRVKTEEMLFLAAYFVHRGIRKIRLTGGEPTLRGDLEQIIRWYYDKLYIGSIPSLHVGSLSGLRQNWNQFEQLAMTTNGVVFRRRAGEFKTAGLDSVNISLDSLRPERVLQISGRPVFKHAIASLHSALELQFCPIKVTMWHVFAS